MKAFLTALLAPCLVFVPVVAACPPNRVNVAHAVATPVVAAPVLAQAYVAPVVVAAIPVAVVVPLYSATYTPAPVPANPANPEPSAPEAPPPTVSAAPVQTQPPPPTVTPPADPALKELAEELKKLREELERLKALPTPPGNTQYVEPPEVATLRTRCASCHSDSVAKEKGKGFILFGPDLAPVKLQAASQRKVLAKVGTGQMPPKIPLSDADRKQVFKWIETLP